VSQTDPVSQTDAEPGSGAGPGAGAGAAAGAGPGAGADRRWLAHAIELSRRSPPSATAFSVGAVLVSADGRVLSTGFSRELDAVGHAEEVALAKLGLADGPPDGDPGRLAGATMYSSLEPCAVRSSRPLPCADLLIASGIGRVVIAWLEPPILAPGGGAARLRAAGVTVEVIPELGAAARAVNAHLLPG
jgi:diaminohydroxyphosphoribosylaminopyrimidine deaminase / 5-amino-6-(5-phosphoribosylamino)uracil reductase